MELLPDELRAQIPTIAATQEDDPMVWAMLTNPVSGWRWYLIAMEQVDTDVFYFGYMVGWDEAMTHFNHSDLDAHAAEVGEPNQLDATFTPCRLSVVLAQEWGRIKFPLGRVVATPGALAALEATEQHPVWFLMRHVRGDWGELDAEDVKENEFSLAHGLRLLSAYRLADGTHIWVITEADRSVTTVLLPEEY
jgi:hypothetical protein